MGLIFSGIYRDEFFNSRGSLDKNDKILRVDGFPEDFFSPTVFGVFEDGRWESVEILIHEENRDWQLFSSLHIVVVFFDEQFKVWEPLQVNVLKLVLVFESFDLLILVLELEPEELVVLFELLEKVILLAFSVVFTHFNKSIFTFHKIKIEVIVNFHLVQ